MIISGLEKELGATYEARRIVDNELVYGIAVIKVDDEKSYLIQRFETDDSTDGTPALAYYISVQTKSVSFIKDEENKNNPIDAEKSEEDGRWHCPICYAYVYEYEKQCCECGTKIKFS